MHRLGHTRSSYQPDHLLLTPDTFVRAPLPGMRGATAIVHAGAALGAAFKQYTAEFEPDGALGEADGQRFVYVLEGRIAVDGTVLGAGGYAYVPEGCAKAVTALERARTVVIEKQYEPLEGENPPAFFTATEQALDGVPLLGDPDLMVRTLMPPLPAFDFAMNTLTFQPGAALPMVEMHVMEHGLMMLEGGGIYRLGEKWYPVTAGDFIWMAPYCQQWFAAVGKSPAKYLLYKDWNR